MGVHLMRFPMSQLEINLRVLVQLATLEMLEESVEESKRFLDFSSSCR
jgi:hypothetical protein